MGVPPPAFRYRTTGNSSNADGSGYPLYLLRICEDRKKMSLLSLTLHAVKKKQNIYLLLGFLFSLFYLTTVASSSTFNVSNNTLTSMAVKAVLILCWVIHP